MAFNFHFYLLNKKTQRGGHGDNTSPAPEHGVNQQCWAESEGLAVWDYSSQSAAAAAISVAY